MQTCAALFHTNIVCDILERQYSDEHWSIKMSKQEIAILADVLAGRKTVGTIEGNVAFAGVKPTTEFLRRYTGYVEQFGT